MTETSGSIAERPAPVSHGVVRIPALVVDEQVVLSGRVPTLAQVRDLLTGMHSSQPRQ